MPRYLPKTFGRWPELIAYVWRLQTRAKAIGL